MTIKCPPRLIPYAASAAILASVGGIGLWARGAPAEGALKIEPIPLAKTQPTIPGPSAAVQRSLVHVAGEVLRPGVYELPPNGRVADALRLAGGMKATAASELVNLAAPLRDGQKLLIPPRNVIPARETFLPRVASARETRARRSSRPTPRPLSGEIVIEPMAVAPPESLTTEAAVESPRPRSNAGVAPVSKELAPGSISLNFASAAELDRLPGVGPATAAKIVEERSRRGRFRSIEDLLDVKGIGPVKLAKMRPYLTL